MRFVKAGSLVAGAGLVLLGLATSLDVSAGDAFDGGTLTLVVAQLAIGAALVVGALVALAGDHRGLQRRATTDALTGLPNRAEFERRAGAVLVRAERDGTGACLVVVDLDRFKIVNDSVGHAGGDRVLVEVAVRLRMAVRGTDLIARWGGDEFVLLLPGTADPLAIRGRIEAIAAGLSSIPTVDGAMLSASVGAAVAPLHGRDVSTLLDAADRAMYASKLAAVARTRAPEVAGRSPLRTPSGRQE